MSLPKITIITPSYNQGEFLEDTIRSVLDQNYPNLEYFVVDGGSTDNSVEIIERYAENFDWWVSEKDRGQSHAINKGLERATGEIVTWLNSDDFFYPGALDMIAQAAVAHPEAGLFIGNGTIADRQGRRVRRYSKTLAFDYNVLLRGANYILQPSTFLRKRVFDEQGPIDEKITYGMDLELWLRVGNKYPVVTIDEELAAFRWYDEVKSVSGGFKEWVSMYEITRRYCKDPITPGLVVEFFKKLQDQKIQAAAGFTSLGELSQKTYWTLYQEMQSMFGTNDCIPRRNRGIPFKPRRKQDISVSDIAPAQSTEKASAPASSPEQLVVDVVLPAGHSWFVREGYAKALKQLGSLGRVLYVPSWKQDEAGSAELFEHLGETRADVIFLMDTMWHAQQVHATDVWRGRWAECRARKVMFSFECMSNPWLRQNSRWWSDTLGAVERTAACVDGIVFAHEIDESLFRQFGLPALWQPFAVDENILPALPDFGARKPRAFFKGKADAFYDDEQCYQARRRLIKFLRQHSTVTDVIDNYSYAAGGVLERNQQFLGEMGEYQTVIGLPSLSPTMVVRPFEALLSGCVFFQNRVQGVRSNQLFRDGEHLFLYDADQPEQLAAKIQEVLANPELGRQIAENGRREVLARHTIQHRVAEVLPWVKESVTRRVPVTPSAASTPPATATPRSNVEVIAPARRPRGSKILIDGITFEFQNNRPAGISRVWTSLLKELSRSPLARDIILLDRGHTAPRIPGLETRSARRYDLHHFDSDSIYLQQICDREKAGLFISTYYTYPENTPSMIMLHDMIPEITGQDLSHPEWRAKTKAIEKAFGYFSVSQSTRNDFQKLCPEFASRKMFLTPNAVGGEFRSMPATGVTAFRLRHEIEKPYFLLVGNRTAYKNAHLFFRAFSSWAARDGFEVVCAGGADKLEDCFSPFVRGVRHHVLRLGNDELAAAYTGAVAVVYPSRYEGFGLPVLEAHKCSCPVITCRNSSLPEVAGEAALFVGESDVAGLQAALVEIQKPETRKRLIALGLENIQRFSWENTARIVADAIQEVRNDAASLELRSSDPLDTVDRLIAALETGGHSGRVITNLQLMANVYRGRARYQRESASAGERKLATALATMPEQIRQAISAPEESDSLLSYVFGLVAEDQREFPKAVALYTAALKSVTDEYGASYRLRLGLRLANLAARNDRRPLAKSIVEQVVLPSQRAAGETIRFGSEARELLGDLREELILDRSLLVEPRASATPSRIGRSETQLVSAIVSTYNSEKFLRGCLEDLERQTIADRLEIVVVDSGSTQDERTIVEEFQAKYSNIVYLRTEERETLGAAWNRGIKVARGRYITSANTDDRHRRDALEVLARTLDENPDVVLAYGDCHVTRTENETFETAKPVQTYQWLDFNATELLRKGCFVGPQPMWRHDVHEEHGYFNADYVAAGDYEFWLRLAQNKKFLHVKEFLGLYLESPTSVEHSNQTHLLRETAEAQRRYADAILKPGTGVKHPSPDRKAAALGDGGHGKPAQQTHKTRTLSTVPSITKIGQLDQARTLLTEKKYQEAWELTTAALKVRPFHPEAYLLLAQIAMTVGGGATARRCAQRAHDLAPQWKPAKQFLKKPLPGNTHLDWLVVPEPNGNRLTVCVIARNEEQYLAQCLESVRGIANQVIVVDTGSMDRTVEIARQQGAEVHSFSWCDDFSAARNAALEHATGDWVLSLDADEELPAETHAKLREHLGDAAAMAFRLPLVDHGKEAAGWCFVPRLFRNAPGLFWNGRVHEQAFVSLEILRKQWKLENKLGEATILHHGYSMDVAQRTAKSERNRRLLKLALAEQPGNANLLMNLGLELTRCGQLDEGIDQYRQAIGALANQSAEEIAPEFLETLLTQLCTHLMAKKHFEEVVGLLHSPLAQSRTLSASLHFALGLSHMEQKQFDNAVKEFRQCLAKRDQPALTPINTDILTSAPSRCLAMCLAQTGEAVEALKILHQIVAENATDTAAWTLGGTLALQHPDFVEFACDWTGEAIKYLPENSDVMAKRAEALLLTGKAAEALPLWRQAQTTGDIRAAAAEILCAILAGESPTRPSIENEALVSKEFLKWYRRLLNWGEERMLLRLNEATVVLQSILPSAAAALEAALAEASQTKV